MCSVIGFTSINYNDVERKLLVELFKQSQIRGKHATGLSFLNDNFVHTLVHPLPSKEFIEVCDNFNFLDQKDLFLIGHTRYSTSDLEYNQPIEDNNISIVHNGIITQEFPEKWEEHYGYKCKTKNDSELILRCIENGEHPLIKFKSSSIAALVLKDGEIRFFRNGNRPLWYFEYNGSFFISSTRDILKRTFMTVLQLEINPIKCDNGEEYKIDSLNRLTKEFININEEQQIELNCSNYYRRVEV